jgi:cytochrome c oxidase cbb3-type subunit 3
MLIAVPSGLQIFCWLATLWDGRPVYRTPLLFVLMGPSLSNNIFVYGSEPENIYLSIHQGRPNGMPAWGAVLPDAVIWDLVTYIGKLSNEPNRQWGRTFSQSPLSPDVEQLPSQQVTTSDPWSGTRKFSSGQKP